MRLRSSEGSPMVGPSRRISICWRIFSMASVICWRSGFSDSDIWLRLLLIGLGVALEGPTTKVMLKCSARSLPGIHPAAALGCLKVAVRTVKAQAFVRGSAGSCPSRAYGGWRAACQECARRRVMCTGRSKAIWRSGPLGQSAGARWPLEEGGRSGVIPTHTLCLGCAHSGEG